MNSAAPGPPTGPPDVLVVGAGIIGLAVAWRATRAGLTVSVLDASPGDGATWAAAGMLAAVTEAEYGEDRLARMNVDSARRWPRFAQELEDASGTDVGLRATGTMTLAYDADDLAESRRLARTQQRWGMAITELTAAQARRRSPLVGSVAGASWAADDHQVDPRAAHRALRRAVVGTPGCGILPRRVARLLVGTGTTDDGVRVTGVVDDRGEEHQAGTVVLAAGERSSSLLAGLPVDAPTRPVKGLTLRLDAPAWFDLDHVVRGRVQSRAVYVVPRAPGTDPGTGAPRREVVIGASSEEKPDDRRAEAGAVFALLRDARALLPAVDELALVEITPRARPATPDNLPFVGASGVPGLVLATGHHRNGVLLAPITGDAVVATLTGGALPGSVAAVDPRRLTDRTPRPTPRRTR
ncbi:glycine oxidase ThiO [Cellulomonas sp. PhB143]|uniref:glycine oxidase ThiO n=1 Tax=Cellulomonas sp. PhB143 TaxID=2485186 RepID=UPI000F46D1EC|nr:glycine oxidase ThiO [Cellulomonas sp. PhB143]ROS78996.1 glycine oxidase [Cellulomonas sp. PhB143]